jgi:hypothetical protein
VGKLVLFSRTGRRWTFPDRSGSRSAGARHDVCLPIPRSRRARRGGHHPGGFVRGLGQHQRDAGQRQGRAQLCATTMWSTSVASAHPCQTTTPVDPCRRTPVPAGCWAHDACPRPEREHRCPGGWRRTEDSDAPCYRPRPGGEQGWHGTLSGRPWRRCGSGSSPPGTPRVRRQRHPLRAPAAPRVGEPLPVWWSPRCERYQPVGTPALSGPRGGGRGQRRLRRGVPRPSAGRGASCSGTQGSRRGRLVPSKGWKYRASMVGPVTPVAPHSGPGDTFEVAGVRLELESA